MGDAAREDLVALCEWGFDPLAVFAQLVNLKVDGFAEDLFDDASEEPTGLV